MNNNKELEYKPDLESSEKLLQELSGPRALINRQKWAVYIIAVAWSLFQLALGSFLLLNSTLERCIHLAFALVLIFLSYPTFKSKKLSSWFPRLANKSRFNTVEVIITLVAALAALYIALDYTGIATRIGTPITRDRIIGVLLFVAVLEAARRVVGPALPVMALLLTLHSIFGQYMPLVIAFKGLSLDRLLGQITMSTEGIYGVPLGVSASIVFLFVLLGAMLEKAGGGKYFIDVATSLLGTFRGGPAKAAVVSSGLTGMVSGSSIANVVTVGTFTIPLMKSVGYTSTKAGAIETACSVNGQLMPPIMGAAAFIMAEYLNLPYLDVVKAAFLPAIVTYATLFYIVHLEAMNLGLKRLTRDVLPPIWRTFIRGSYYLIPLVVLVVKLVVYRHTPASSAFLAIVFLAVLMLIQHPIKAYTHGEPLGTAFKQGVKDIFDSLAAGAENMVTVAVATAAAGIIVGIVTMGLGFMITEAVDYVSGGYILPMLVITAICSLLLGMGLPTTANYIVIASLTAPIIVTVGKANGFVVPMIAAHMFVFYFGIMADVTPPVGLAAFAASAIAKSNPVATGVQGFVYNLQTVLLPFMFIFNAELLMVGIHHWYMVVALYITAIAGAFSFANISIGRMMTRNKWWEYLFLAFAAFTFFQPERVANWLGIPQEIKYSVWLIAAAAWGLIFLSQKIRIRKVATAG